MNCVLKQTVFSSTGTALNHFAEDKGLKCKDANTLSEVRSVFLEQKLGAAHFIRSNGLADLDQI